MYVCIYTYIHTHTHMCIYVDHIFLTHSPVMIRDVEHPFM